MKMFSAACLAVTTALTFAGSSQAQQPAGSAQVQAVTVSHSNCQHCQHGHQHAGQCNNPACPLSRFQVYPDGGFNPPVNMPVNYNWAQYQQIVPAHPYGTPGGGFTAQYPIVAQPADTAQAGYYLHKVPMWQPQPGMIPPTPNPALFHNRLCPVPGQTPIVHQHVSRLHASANTLDSQEGVVRITSSRKPAVAAGPAVQLPVEAPVPVVAAPKPVPAAKAVAAKPVAAAPAASRTVVAPAEKTPVRTASAPSTAKVQAKPAVKSAAPARKPAFRLSSLFD